MEESAMTEESVTEDKSTTYSKVYDPARRRFYGGVLIFAVLAGIVLTAVPEFRDRLFDRIYILKTAITGEIKTDILPVGESDIPYPEEFMRPRSGAAGAASASAESIKKRSAIVLLNAQPVKPPVLIGSTDSAKPVPTEVADVSEYDDGVKFRQGETEREVYEKTLAVNKKLTALTQGDDPELTFKTWGVAQRDEDVYWVRVIFLNTSGSEVEYRWVMNIASGKSTPLNFAAKSAFN